MEVRTSSYPRSKFYEKLEKEKASFSEVFLVSSKIHNLLRQLDDVRTWCMEKMVEIPKMEFELTPKQIMRMVRAQAKRMAA